VSELHANLVHTKRRLTVSLTQLAEFAGARAMCTELEYSALYVYFIPCVGHNAVAPI
jgi:hypothetical protein